jgi:hypothetical protein
LNLSNFTSSSSTIVEDVTKSFQSIPTAAVVYFYFDFADKGKQLVRSLLCSLAAQVLANIRTTPASLESLYLRTQYGQQPPDNNGLTQALKEMIKIPRQTYIIIDALDECAEREELLRLIEEIVSWNCGNLHLLSTSRRERDIEEALQDLATSQICVQTSLVDLDIQLHVSRQLEHDPRLRKWSTTVKKEIEEGLMRGANWM